MQTYNGRTIKSVKPATQGDADYDATLRQSVVTFEDGSSVTVLTDEIKTVTFVGKWKGKNVVGERPVVAKDSGYDALKPKVYLTLEDGSSVTVPKAEYVPAPYNPANPVSQPVLTGAATTKATLDRIIGELVELRNQMN